ncbi:M23 family metallopeptidase [Clostridium sp. FP1]|uniref:M23 family metallopeptidase n=1 Tax=Clostridium sp. FP1 TaxID=2724076 RepID=UPI0013E93541|nr:M23 family metallopeptidase [Clostridium sp. FP1]MBZ9635145.1 M23 family metallopeptidase [Clostridium sp. FP1]
MKVNRITALAFFFMSIIVIPLFFLGWILIGKDSSKLIWLMKIVICGLYMLLIFIIGYWGFICYYLRYLFGILYVIVSVLSISDMATLPFIYEENVTKFVYNNGFFIFIYLLVTGIMIHFIIKSITAVSYNGTAISLAFPFKSGRYYVFEGGNSKKCSLINYHFAGSSHTKNNVNKSMQYATDIVKLNSIGSFAKNILPKQIEKYAIYKEAIYSPCNGTIIEVVDNRDTEEPFSGNHPYNVGNNIVIQSKGINIVIGHIQRDSIKVKVGDFVNEGQHIANVGNSGLTEFPHLHIQAMKVVEGSIWSGEGIPILFDGKFLVKNTLITKI